MKDWIVVDKENLSQYLILQQIDFLSNIDKNDPLENALIDAVQLVRAEIASNKKNYLDPNPLKIPTFLRPTVYLIVIEQLHSRIPSVELSKTQATSINHARKLLKRIAKGEIKVPNPINPASFLINSKKRIAKSNNLGGF